MTELPRDWTDWRRQLGVAGYDQRWERLAAAGGDPHGEADLVHSYQPGTVLDAGCGTGRVAIELARRGIAVVGVDLDAEMVDAARAKAPELTWVRSDLGELRLDDRFDVVVLAGNVVPYVAPDRRAAAIEACALHLEPGGRLISGYQLMAGWPTLADYDGWCAAAGLVLADRFATWDRALYAGGGYAVSVHRAA